jgi:putative restriction endonuclease
MTYIDLERQSAPLVQDERQHREALWQSLIAVGSPENVAPGLLRELGIYGGAQGVWVDKARTARLTTDGVGATVGLLHTGVHYSDDLSADGVLYHYPHTGRPEARDRSEIEATKATQRLGLPVFVITHSIQQSGQRSVFQGWVEDWDDASKIFLITFRDGPPPQETPLVADVSPFTLLEPHSTLTRQVKARLGQQRFQFSVLKRYGPRCAVCDVGIVDVLDAAHIVSKRERGVDDPRNGLVLCALHHRAYDAGLFAIEPDTLVVRYRSQGPTASELRIVNLDLNHLPYRLHDEAVIWAWKRWTERNGS